MTDRHTQIIVHLHIGALLLGGTAQFSKLIPYSAIDIIVYRTLICGLILLAIALAMHHRLRITNPRQLSLMILCSVLFTVHWTAYFHAMQVSTVAVGIVAMFTFPVMTVFLEPLLRGTRLAVIDVLMGLIVLAGVALIVPELSWDNGITQGVAFGMLSAFAVSIRNILVGKHLSAYSPFVIMTYHGLISFLALVPFSTVPVESIGWKAWLMLLLLGSVFTAIPHTQKTFGLQHASAKTVSMIISLQVVYATLFAMILLDEMVTWQVLLGGGLILGAGLFESIKKGSYKAASSVPSG